VLGALDETLRHQLPTTFDHVGTSDPRFFDRYWFSAYDPQARFALICGMGLYANMNVLDGFAALMLPRAGGGVEQHNYRVSRALRPGIDRTAVGPLSIEIAEPFRHVRLGWQAGESPLGIELDWRSELPALEERPHFARQRGRVAQDYRRYTQVGHVTGRIRLGERSFEVDAWGGRDHSWGVRPQTAGPEPVTGPPDDPAARGGFVFFWLPFRTAELAGHVQLQFLGNGTAVYQHGELRRADGEVLEICGGDLEAEFSDGCDWFRRTGGTLTARAGTKLRFETEPLLSHWSMDGTGYDYGWNDGKGLGWYRGEYASESDVYDLSRPDVVIRPDGSAKQPRHRETPVRVSVDGQPGTGHQVLIVARPCPYLGR
jgi:hypothetical protein